MRSVIARRRHTTARATLGASTIFIRCILFVLLCFVFVSQVSFTIRNRFAFMRNVKMIDLKFMSNEDQERFINIAHACQTNRHMPPVVSAPGPYVPPKHGTLVVCC